MFARSIAGSVIGKVLDVIKAFAMVTFLICFGLGIWTINAHFSVTGLGATLAAFGDWGTQLWSFLTRITIWNDIPLFPFLLCIGVSGIQIDALYAKLTHQKRSAPSGLLTAAVCAYDLATTVFGLTLMPWAQPIPLLVLIVGGIFMTFIFEIFVTYLIKYVTK